MSYVASYKDLIVWQKAIILVIKIYTYTRTFPKSEIFSITSQIRRSALSIPSNIAEGRARSSSKDYHHFLTIAFSSGAELETQLIIAEKLNLGNKNECLEISILLNEIMRILNVTISSVKNKYSSKPQP